MNGRTILLLCALLAPTTPACSAVVSGTGAFDQAQEPLECGSDVDAARVDLAADLGDFSPHVGQLVVLQLVRLGGPVRRVVSTAVYDPFPASEMFIPLSCAIERGPDYRVYLFADANMTGTYEPCPDPDPVAFPDERTNPELACLRSDHQWELEVQADGTLNYRHQLDFDNLGDASRMALQPMQPLVTVVQNASLFVGFPLELQVRRTDGSHAGEVVFLYRLGEIPDGVEELTLTLPNAIPGSLPDESPTYEVALWIDTNFNGHYERPSASGGAQRDYAALENSLGELMVRAVFDLAEPAVDDVRFPY